MPFEGGEERNRSVCRFCGTGKHAHLARFDAPPKGETDFGIEDYRRDLWQCGGCGHVVNRHGYQLHAIYSGEYVDSTYGDRLAAAFRRVMTLRPEVSDNRQRVRRIVDFATAWALSGCRALDVGSGLGVFPAALKEAGWNCVALDPDPRAADHIREAAKVKSLVGDFMAFEPANEDANSFDLVTFNKVLEHVPLPTDMLRRSRRWLKSDGAVYIELPDGESALREVGPERQEFFIEHYDAYSAVSIVLLIRQAGFSCRKLERLIEPSGKYTLAAFATAA